MVEKELSHLRLSSVLKVLHNTMVMWHQCSSSASLYLLSSKCLFVQRLGKTLGFRILLEQTLTHMCSVHTHTETQTKMCTETNNALARHLGFAYCKSSLYSVHTLTNTHTQLHINVDIESPILVVNRNICLIFQCLMCQEGNYQPAPELEIRNIASTDIQCFCKI